MSRTRMEPAARKAELLEAASRVFAEKGVENTAVSEIVAAAGVSQGTFYVYFDSKADVVNAVVQEISERIVGDIVAMAREPGEAALDKLLRMRDEMLSALTDDAALLEFFHRPGNEPFHDQVSRDAVRRIIPALESVIEQGCDEGVFHISHPDDAARFIATLMDVTDPFNLFAQPERFAHHIEALTEFTLRGIGCDDEIVQTQIARLRSAKGARHG